MLAAPNTSEGKRAGTALFTVSVRSTSGLGAKGIKFSHSSAQPLDRVPLGEFPLQKLALSKQASAMVSDRYALSLAGRVKVVVALFMRPLNCYRPGVGGG